MHLTPDQIHILSNAYRHEGYVLPGKLYTRKDIHVHDVENLAAEGLLSRRGGRFCSNAMTEKVLVDAGFDLNSMERIPKVKRQKPKVAVDPNSDALMKFTDMVGEENLKNREFLEQVLYEKARTAALAGDWFPMIRFQWPELIIKDPTDLAYFRKWCERTDNLDLRLDDKQVHLIKMASNPLIWQIAIKGCTSPGKGFVVALCINIMYELYRDAPIILMSQSSDHAKTTLFAEVSTWRRKMRRPCKVDILTDGFKDRDNPKHSLIIANPDSGEGVSGKHSNHTVYIFDEATSVPNEMFTNAEAQARLIIAISNPRTLSGWFYDLYPKTDPDKDQIITSRGRKRACITFGGLDCLNVKAGRLHLTDGEIWSPPGGIEITDLEGNKTYVPEGVPVPDSLKKHIRALIPGQMDIAKYKALSQSADPNEVAWKANGHFPPEDYDIQVVPPSYLERAFAAHDKDGSKIPVTAYGLDIAASEDGDETVLAAGGKTYDCEYEGIKRLHKCRKSNPAQLVQWVVDCARSDGVDLREGNVPVALDVNGIGHSFKPALENAGILVIPILAQASSDMNPKLYKNKRTELYAEFADRIGPNADSLSQFMVPRDDQLAREFVAHQKDWSPDMTRFGLNPKRKKNSGSDNVKKLPSIEEIIGRSPDASDAVVMCYEAIKQSAGDAMVVAQFDPRQHVVHVQKNKDGTNTLEYADGRIEQAIDEPEDVLNLDDAILGFSSFAGGFPF